MTGAGTRFQDGRLAGRVPPSGSGTGLFLTHGGGGGDESLRWSQLSVLIWGLGFPKRTCLRDSWLHPTFGHVWPGLVLGPLLFFPTLIHRIRDTSSPDVQPPYCTDEETETQRGHYERKDRQTHVFLLPVQASLFSSLLAPNNSFILFSFAPNFLSAPKDYILLRAAEGECNHNS